MHECAAVCRCMLLGMIVIEAQKYCSARKYAIKILNFTTMHATCHNSISIAAQRRKIFKPTGGSGRQVDVGWNGNVEMEGVACTVGFPRTDCTLGKVKCLKQLKRAAELKTRRTTNCFIMHMKAAADAVTPAGKQAGRQAAGSALRGS